MKKQPQRMCVSCKTRRDKKELVRVVLKEDGQLTVDPTGKLPGRGVYLCRNEECIRIELKAHRISRGLRENIPGEEIDEVVSRILNSQE